MENYLEKAKEYRTSSPEKAIAELDKINTDKITDISFLVSVYHEYISNYVACGKIDNASDILEKLEPLVQEDEKLQAYCKRIKGVILVEKGKFFESISYFKDVLNIAYKSNDQLRIYNETINIGVLFWKLKKHEKALEYLEKALEIAENNDFPKTDLLLNLSSTYGQLNRLEDSIRVGMICEQEILKTANMIRLPACYINLGSAYSQTGKHEKAIEYYQKTFEAAKASKLSHLFSQANYMIAQNMRDTGETEKALGYLKVAYDYAVEFENLREQETIFREYSQIYSKLGLYEQAYENLVKADELSKQILDDKTAISIARNEAYVEMEQQLNEKEQLLMLYARQAEMGQMIAAIAHQWRQPLNSLSIIFDSIFDAWEFKELTDDSLQMKIASGKEVIYSMSSTINDFRSFFEPKQFEDVFQIKEIIEKSVRFTNYRFRQYNIKQEYTIKSDCELKGSSNQLLQVLLIILNNAFDAFQGKDIEAHCVSILQKVEKGNCIISIADNAGGIPKNSLKKIFTSNYSTKKSSEGTGIGLYLAKMIVELKFNGNIAVMNKDNGAVFTMKIPIVE